MLSIITVFIRLICIFLIALVLNCVLVVIPAKPKVRNRIASIFFQNILKICGIDVRCKFPLAELQSNKKIIIVSNHVSYFDVLIISSLRPCLFLAKKEVAQWPLFGWVARLLGCVFVQRESLMARANALRNCLRLFLTSDIALFPEGTTTAARLPELKSWAKGHAWLAQKSGADSILCLGLVYENQDEIAWTDDMSLVPHLLKTLRRPKIRVTMTGAWVPVSAFAHPAELAITTHQQLCMAVSYECT